MPITNNNTAADSIVNETIKHQRTRSMNMKYFWVIDQQRDKKINVKC